jgi:hypothetical protein
MSTKQNFTDNAICQCSLNEVLGCTNLTLACLFKFLYEQTQSSCLDEITSAHPIPDNIACKQSQKSRIRISGIATLRKHNLPTQRRRREEERAWFIK